jgi:hypothetical protein
LKYGAVGGRRESVGLIVLKRKKYYKVKEERSILHTIKRRKTNCFGHILRRHCLLKHGIEGKILGRTEVMGRRRR